MMHISIQQLQFLNIKYDIFYAIRYSIDLLLSHKSYALGNQLSSDCVAAHTIVHHIPHKM